MSVASKRRHLGSQKEVFSYLFLFYCKSNMSCDIGVYGLGVMGTNLALNIASKGFNVAVSNRSTSKVCSE